MQYSYHLYASQLTDWSLMKFYQHIATNVTGFIVVMTFLSGLYGGAVYCQTATFSFNPVKGHSAVKIRIDSLLEMNKGTADIIDGLLCLDPPTRTISCGKIIIPSSAIVMSNRVKTAMLHSKKWLNKNDFPNIVFEFNTVEKTLSSTKNIQDVVIRGALTIKGITRTADIPLKIECANSFDAMEQPNGGNTELSLSSSFSISRSEFNIKPDIPAYLIDDTIFLDIYISGVANEMTP